MHQGPWVQTFSLCPFLLPFLSHSCSVSISKQKRDSQGSDNALSALASSGRSQGREEKKEGVCCFLGYTRTDEVLISVTMCLMPHKTPTEHYTAEAGLIL